MTATTKIDGAALVGPAWVEPAPTSGNGSKPADSQAAPTGPAPAEIPSLPETAQLDPDLGRDAGKWLADYVTYADDISPMTPQLFHESAALWLASVATARRVVLHMAHGDIYPNLCILWLARTTLFAKSTGLNVARQIAWQVVAHLLSSQEATPEALLVDMAGIEPPDLEKRPEADKELWRKGRNFAGQRGWVLDELSGLLASAGRDYNAGLLEAILRFIDADPLYTRSTRALGRISVRNSYLAMLGASTPRAMAPHLATGSPLWGNGWWPRFAILCPETERPAWRESREPDDNAKQELIAKLMAIYDALPSPAYPAPATAKSATIDPKAFQAWRNYDKALRFDLLTEGLPEDLYGLYGRLPTQALKVATLLATIDRADMPAVTLAHFARAQAIAESWRASAHRVMSLTKQADSDKLADRIIKQVSKAGAAGITARDVRMAMRDVETWVLEKELDGLVSMGELTKVERKPGSKGGRPTAVYSIPTE